MDEDKEKVLFDIEIQQSCEFNEPSSKCGEIFFRSPNVLSLVCLLCEKSFDGLHIFGNHLITEHVEAQFETKCQPFECLLLPTKLEDGDDQMVIKQEESNADSELDDSSFDTKNNAKYRPTIKTPDSYDGKLFICSTCGLQYKQNRTYRIHLKKCHQTANDRKKKERLSHSKTMELKLPNSIPETLSEVPDGAAEEDQNIVVEMLEPENIIQSSTLVDIEIIPQGNNTPLRDTPDETVASDDSSHELSDNSRPELECDLCGFKYVYKSAYKQHMTQVHKKTVAKSDMELFECSTCGSRYIHKRSLMKHEQKVHGIKSMRELLRMERQKQGQTISCSICDRVYCHNKSLQDHMARDHPNHDATEENPGKTLCKYCREYFNGKYKLKKHIETEHSSDYKYKCPHCDRRFRSDGGRQSHILSHTGERPYKCKYCGKGFAHKGNLTVHIYTHLNIKKVACRHCDMKFVKTTERNIHERRHMKQKPFQCELCGQQFLTHTLLAYHRRSHTNERNYKCTVCDKAFFTNGLLKSHMEIHNEVGAYECSVCKKAFRARKGLAQHMKLHAAVKQYVCGICGAAFAQSAGLYLHRKNHNKCDESTDCS